MAIYRTTSAAPKTESEKRPMTLERAHKIVSHLERSYVNAIPMTIAKLNDELRKSIERPTEKLITWINVISNLFIVDNRIKVTPESAKLVEFIIGEA